MEDPLVSSPVVLQWGKDAAQVPCRRLQAAALSVTLCLGAGVRLGEAAWWMTGDRAVGDHLITLGCL